MPFRLTIARCHRDGSLFRRPFFVQTGYNWGCTCHCLPLFWWIKLLHSKRLKNLQNKSCFGFNIKDWTYQISAQDSHRIAITVKILLWIYRRQERWSFKLRCIGEKGKLRILEILLRLDLPLDDTKHGCCMRESEREGSYQESANECKKDASAIDGSSVDTNRVQHHVHLLLRSHKEGCAAKEKAMSRSS